MVVNKNVYQVVFLVDLSASVPEGEDDSSSEKILNFIRLGSLKILTYFSNKFKADFKLKNLRWGFKFYNSVSLSLKVTNYHLNEFTLKHFEEFENELDSKFEAERLKCHGLVRHKNGHSEQESVNNVTSLDDEDPGYKLKKCLREICQDFQWDRPDVSSPVRPSKGRGRGRSLLQAESQQYNYVFLFSPCPHSVGRVGEYFGTDFPLQSTSLLETFMPNSTFRVFHEQSKINLFWVDVDCDPLKQDNHTYGDLEGMGLVHSALRMLGGGVLPINSILHMGKHTNTLISNLLQRTDVSKENKKRPPCSEEGPPCQASASCPRERASEVAAELVLSATRVLEYYTSLNFLTPTIDDIGGQGLLVAGKGSAEQILGQVELKSMLRGTTSSSRQKVTTRWSVQASGCKATEERLNIAILPSANIGKVDVAKEEGQSLEIRPGNQVKYKQDSAIAAEDSSLLHVLEVRGTLAQSSLPIEVLQADLVTMVTAAPGKEWGNFNFSHLLLQLAKLRLVLVVDCCRPSIPVPSTCILQPLTSLSATLTFVRSDVNFVLEKLLCFGKKSQPSPAQKADDVQTFIGNTVTHLLKAKRGRRKPHEAMHIQPKDGESRSNDIVIKEAFKPSFMEAWCLPGLVSSCSDELLKSLRTCNEPSGEGHTSEYAILKQLQQHYHSEDTLSTISTSESRSPRKNPKSIGYSPRRKGRKSPRKTPRKCTSPRKSPRKKALLSNKASVPIRRSPRKAELKRVKSMTGPIRSASILDRSHQVVAMQDEIDDSEVEKGRVHTGRRHTKQDFTTKVKQQEFQDETDLLEHLKKNYEDGLDITGTPLFCAQSIVNVAVHFIRSTEAPEAEQRAQDFLHVHILLTSKQTREKHAKLGQSIGVDNKIQEFQLQVLLYLEIEALLPREPAENAVGEVVNMLRSMSFLKDPNYLTSYVNDVLLENYKDSVPAFLGQIYEGLLLPVPALLEALLSPEEDEDESSMAGSVMPPSYKSDTSVNPSILCDSNMTLRSRKMTHFPSFDALPKRQIAVPNLKKPKVNERSKMCTRSAKKKKKTVDSKSEKQMVRRNLFEGVVSKGTKLERRASLAVMESTHSLSFGRRKPVPSTPKAHHVLKTSNVTETPSHKQTRNSLWRKQEKERRRTHTLADVMIVEESPQKMPSQLSGLKNSPRRASLGSVGLKRRQSFYSGAPQSKSRNVVKFERHRSLLEVRMTTKSNISPTASETKSLKISPSRRIQPVSLFSLLHSPSPPKRFAGFMSPTKQTASKRLYQDSPSKNTRLQISLMSPQGMNAVRRINPNSPVKHTRSPNLQARQLRLDFDSPSKHTRSRSLMSPTKDVRYVEGIPPREISHNPFQVLKSPTRPAPFLSPSRVRSTPGKQCYTPRRQCYTPSRKTLSGELLSPRGRTSPVKNIRPTFKQNLFADNLNPNFTSPSKNTRSKKQRSPLNESSFHENSLKHLSSAEKQMASLHDVCDRASDTSRSISNGRLSQNQSSFGSGSVDKLPEAAMDGRLRKPRRLQTAFEDIGKENMASIKPFGISSEASCDDQNSSLGNARKCNTNDAIQGKPCGLENHLPSEDPVQSDELLSPRRSSRVRGKPETPSSLKGRKQLCLDFASPMKDQQLVTVRPLSTSPASNNRLNSISHINTSKDPKIPDSLDKWPRKKPRHFMNSSATMDSDCQTDICKDNSEDELELASTDLKRKVKGKQSGSRQRRSTDSTGKTAPRRIGGQENERDQSNEDPQEIQEFQHCKIGRNMQQISIPNSTPSTKRKHSPRGADAEIINQAEILSGTPSKRRRTTLSSRGSVPSAFQDYFTSEEVFLESSSSSLNAQPQPSIRQVNLARRLGSYDSDSRFSWVDGEDSRDSAVFNSHFMQQKHLPRHLSSISGVSDAGSNIDSEYVSSPIFENSRLNKLPRTQSGDTSEYASDSNVSGPNSPVFHRSVSKIRKCLKSENEKQSNSLSAAGFAVSASTSSQSSSLHSSPGSIKTSSGTRCTPEINKFSPSVSAMSLAHLICSPLVEGGTEPNLSLSSDRHSGSPNKTDRKSRRALNMV